MKSALGYSCFGWRIPERMAGGIDRYIQKGILPGDFLEAVLHDSLKDCVSRADDENMRQLPAYVYYFYNEAPMHCWGSEQRVKDWIAMGGLEGMARQHEKEQEEMK